MNDIKKRRWWLVDSWDVREVVAQACDPPSSGGWYCFEIRGVRFEGRQLFETKDEAVAKAISDTEWDLKNLYKQLETLKGLLPKKAGGE